MMLLHRLFWKDQDILKKLGIIKRSKLLSTVGIILLGVAIGGQPSAIKDK